jgi:release factor glutamine methyltransferase
MSEAHLGPSLAELLAEGAATLRAAGVDAARQTASLLLRETLKTDTTTLIAHPERRVTEADAARIRSAWTRRAAGEPSQYVVGVQEFYGLEFQVTPATLIPRPETESLVDAALEFCRARGLDSPRILDVGTGSGCIVVALLTHLTHARATAVDISPSALAVARANAVRHGVSERISFLEGDLAAPVRSAPGAPGDYDLLVSNPPYVSEADFPTLQREVRDFEPKIALVGGARGTEMYERLFAEAPDALAPHGAMTLEIGFGQLDQVSEIGAAHGWARCAMRRDLQGIPRIVTFQRRAAPSR